jgi:hypothetical protein
MSTYYVNEYECTHILDNKGICTFCGMSTHKVCTICGAESHTTHEHYRDIMSNQEMTRK